MMKRSRRNVIWHSGLLLSAFILAGLLFATGCSGQQGAMADQQQLNTLITGYFASWSKPDMAAYKACFHPLASIYYIDGAGKPHYSQLEEFIAGQEKTHQAARQRLQPLTERPTKVSLAVEGRLARAAVRWELHQGSAAATGTDYYTFIKTDAGWRILSLVFEQDKK